MPDKPIQKVARKCIGSLPSPVDSMREATFTVSPKRQYLGIACPTTPVSNYAAYTHTPHGAMSRFMYAIDNNN